MTMDTYSMNDKQARCSECAKFMPWTRSRQVEKSDGMPSPSPVLIEIGMCETCENRISAKATRIIGGCNEVSHNRGEKEE